MKILVDCEKSQAVTIAFRIRGHEAYSCDLQECTGAYPEYHIQGDAIEALHSQKWDLVIAHPPCTYLCNSGVRWLHTNPERWLQLKQAIWFFKQFMEYAKKTGVPVGIENPIPHKYAVNGFDGVAGIGKYSQTIQPYEFGHPESKRTCLWLLNGLQPLSPTDILLRPSCGYWHNQTPSGQNKLSPKNRAEIRSITYPGIAKAMAEQWG